MTTLFAVGLAVVSAICIVDGLLAGKTNKTPSDYFLQGGSLTILRFVGSILSTNLSLGNFLIFAASWCYAFGWSGLFWFIVNLIANAVAFYLCLPKFRAFIENKKNTGTVHEYLATSFCGEKGSDPNTPEFDAAKSIRQTASLATGICLLLALAFELHLAAQIAAPLLKASPVFLFCAFAFVIGIYASFGGYRSVLTTDAIQAICLVLGTAAAVALMMRIPSAPNALTTTYPTSDFSLWSIGWTNIVGIVVVGSGWFLVGMDNWQRTCATRSYSRSAWGFGGYTMLVIVFGIIYGLWGMYDKAVILPSLTGAAEGLHSGGGNPISDFFLKIGSLSQFDSVLFAGVAVALVMAAMSTADTFLIVCAQTFAADVILVKNRRANWSSLTDEENESLVRTGRALVFLLTAAVIIVWIPLYLSGVLSDPISFFFIAYSVQYALLAPVLCSLLPKERRPLPSRVRSAILTGVVVALVVGFGAWIGMQRKASPLLGIEMSAWMALAPVVATVFWGGVLLPQVLRKRTNATEPA